MLVETISEETVKICAQSTLKREIVYGESGGGRIGRGALTSRDFRVRYRTKSRSNCKVHY